MALPSHAQGTTHCVATASALRTQVLSQHAADIKLRVLVCVLLCPVLVADLDCCSCRGFHHCSIKRGKLPQVIGCQQQGGAGTTTAPVAAGAQQQQQHVAQPTGHNSPVAGAPVHGCSSSINSSSFRNLVRHSAERHTMPSQSVAN